MEATQSVHLQRASTPVEGWLLPLYTFEFQEGSLQSACFLMKKIVFDQVVQKS